ncbi:hypothetical protein Btru_052011 [Bulinus truncatus]|nr:hypothetical protein Btru_052011 [Bulinus truncatus]
MGLVKSCVGQSNCVVLSSRVGQSSLMVSFSKSHLPRDINGKTKILPGETNYTFKVGDVAELECPVANLGDRKVVWRLAANDTIFTIGDHIFTEDPRVAVKHNKGMWNLIIKDVQQRDAGLYECQISSVEKYLRSYVALHVIVSVLLTQFEVRAFHEICPDLVFSRLKLRYEEDYCSWKCYMMRFTVLGNVKFELTAFGNVIFEVYCS